MGVYLKTHTQKSLATEKKNLTGVALIEGLSSYHDLEPWALLLRPFGAWAHGLA